MTLDEAIAHAIEVAENCEEQAKQCDSDDRYERHVMHENAKCAADHRQLAEWLRELKEAKRLLGEALRALNDGSCNKDCRQCKWNNSGCEYGCRFDWKYSDEVSALIGETNVDQ